MTVQKLIALLQYCHPDAFVRAWDPDSGEMQEASGIVYNDACVDICTDATKLMKESLMPTPEPQPDRQLAILIAGDIARSILRTGLPYAIDDVVSSSTRIALGVVAQIDKAMPKQEKLRT